MYSSRITICQIQLEEIIASLYNDNHNSEADEHDEIVHTLYTEIESIVDRQQQKAVEAEQLKQEITKLEEEKKQAVDSHRDMETKCKMNVDSVKHQCKWFREKSYSFSFV